MTVSARVRKALGTEKAASPIVNGADVGAESANRSPAAWAPPTTHSTSLGGTLSSASVRAAARQPSKSCASARATVRISIPFGWTADVDPALGDEGEQPLGRHLDRAVERAGGGIDEVVSHEGAVEIDRQGRRQPERTDAADRMA